MFAVTGISGRLLLSQPINKLEAESYKMDLSW